MGKKRKSYFWPELKKAGKGFMSEGLRQLLFITPIRGKKRRKAKVLFDHDGNQFMYIHRNGKKEFYKK
jgi:hypothetical protein